MSFVPRLLTIPLSHFCEKARWALDRCGIAYREEPHVPLLHRLHTARVGCGSVPALITEAGVLPDSRSILHWAAERSPDGQRLYPAEIRAQVLETEQYLDRELGPHARRWAYSHLLHAPRLLLPCFARGTPRIERLMAPLVVLAVRPLIRRAYRVDESSGRASLARAEAALTQAARWLADGRRYLLGDTFTAADLTLASLAAPLVCVPQYGGAMPPFALLPAAMRADIERLRATAAGDFVLRLYARERAS